MNEIITTTHLKQLIVEATHSEPAFVDVFIDDMINLIIETVMKGEDVEIEGLGTFRLVTIGGGTYTRVVFFADEKMKEGVNAPFSQFEPIVLDPGNPKQEHKSAHLVNTKEAETEVTAFVLNEETDMKRNPESSSPENKGYDGQEQDVNERNREDLAEVQEPVEVSDGNDALSEQVDQVVNQAVEEETGEKCTDGVCPTTGQISGRTGFWFVIILLAVAILATMAYFFVRINDAEQQPESVSPVNEAVSQSITSQTPSNSSIQISSAAEKVQESPAPAAVQQKKPVNELRPANRESERTERPAISFPLKVILKQGERLTLLSKRYYGSKVFWVYIYDANKKQYPDPENVPAGAEIIIPDPVKYDINKENQKSVQKAKERAAAILAY